MSRALCLLCLLATAAGVEPTGIAPGSSAGEGFAAEICVEGGTAPALAHPLAPGLPLCGGCGTPVASLHFCPRRAQRWYTGINVEYYRRPYNYRVQFDYPWQLGMRCGVFGQTLVPADRPPLPHAVLASPRLDGSSLINGTTLGRRSAIRSVD